MAWGKGRDFDSQQYGELRLGMAQMAMDADAAALESPEASVDAQAHLLPRSDV